MYSYTYLELLYSGLAILIFAGWWFVWCLHILAIIYGKYRLHRPLPSGTPLNYLRYADSASKYTLANLTPQQNYQATYQSPSPHTSIINQKCLNNKNNELLHGSFKDSSFPPPLPCCCRPVAKSLVITPSLNQALTPAIVPITNITPDEFSNPNFTEEESFHFPAIHVDESLDDFKIITPQQPNQTTTIPITTSTSPLVVYSESDDWKRIKNYYQCQPTLYESQESKTSLIVVNDHQLNSLNNSSKNGNGAMILTPAQSHQCYPPDSQHYVCGCFQSDFFDPSNPQSSSKRKQQHCRSFSTGCHNHHFHNYAHNNYGDDQQISSHVISLSPNTCALFPSVPQRAQPNCLNSPSPPPLIPQKNHHVRHILSSAYGKEVIITPSSQQSQSHHHYRSLSGGAAPNADLFASSCPTHHYQPHRVINFAPPIQQLTSEHCCVPESADSVIIDIYSHPPPQIYRHSSQSHNTLSNYSIALPFFTSVTTTATATSIFSTNITSMPPPPFDTCNQRSAVAYPPPPPSPGVTIIKPLLGIDSNLAFNLETFFRLEYPKFEICFCIQDYQDPCISLVKKLIAKYPNIDASLFLGSPDIVVNAKINNMLPAYNAAKYELILISDAGIMMAPDALTDMVNAMTNKVGLVHQMPFVVDRKGFSSILEKVYFGTSHARIYLVSDFLGVNCCTGMSSMFRKCIIDPLPGGLAWFGKYLAEDYFMACAVRNAGYKHKISSYPALQNPSPSEASTQGIRAFHERLIRWSKLRFTMVPMTMFFEPLSECFVLGLMNSWAVFYLFEWNSLIFFAVHCFVWFLLDYTLLKIVQNGGIPFSRINYTLAWLYREISALPLFLVALNTSSHLIKWKNKTYKLRWGGYVEKISEKASANSKKSKTFSKQTDDYDFNNDATTTEGARHVISSLDQYEKVNGGKACKQHINSSSSPPLGGNGGIRKSPLPTPSYYLNRKLFVAFGAPFQFLVRNIWTRFVPSNLRNLNKLRSPLMKSFASSISRNNANSSGQRTNNEKITNSHHHHKESKLPESLNIHISSSPSLNVMVQQLENPFDSLKIY